ncbi:MAG TPA: branched-chain amino acid ABC transporter substrate-binding protein, partial [Xanthobacteraceae bacterium]
MNRRSVIKLAGATALTAPFGFRNARAQDATIKIGVVGPRTGVMASGGAVTHWPNFKLWESEINAKGGLK